MKKLLLLGLSAQLLFAVNTQNINSNEIVSSSVDYKEKKYYSITVPNNKEIEVTLTGLSADADLFIKTNTLPRIRKNDCHSSNSSTANEECSYTVTGDESNKVNILVYGFRSANYTLKASILEPKVIEEIFIGKNVQKHINMNKSENYKFSGKKGTLYKINLDKLSADADLRVMVGKKASKHKYSCKSTNGGTQTDSCEIKLKDDATVYVNVFGFRDADYTLSVQENINNNPPISREELRNMIENNKDVRNVNTSEITDMSHMCSTRDFNQDISNWDVSNVTNMENMFYYALDFNQDISAWDVSKVTNMDSMFNNARSFNKPLNSWDVSSVTNMFKMFMATESFNQPLNNWKVGNVKTMSQMFGQMYGHTIFNQPINNWDVSGVIDLGAMFFNSDFNQKLSDWDVSNVSDMSHMFYHGKFQQDIEKWNVSSKVNMDYMFTDDKVSPILPSWYTGGVGLNPDFEGNKK